MTVEFLSEALEDIFQIAAHYEGEKAGLGERFVGAVRRVATNLEAFPRVGALVAGPSADAGEQRRYRLREFPFVLFYEVEEVTDELGVVVFAVVHEKRKPRRWDRK